MSGDPELAKFMREHDIKAPVERIIRIDWVLVICNRKRLKPGERIVELECGHRAVTKNRVRVACAECHEMILNGEDYEAFRFRRNEQ